MPRTRLWDMDEAIRLRNEYWTFDDLGDRYGVTAQAVQQAIRPYVTVTAADLRAARQALLDRIHEENADEIWRRRDIGEGVARIARALYLEEAPLRRWIKKREGMRERDGLTEPRLRVVRGTVLAVRIPHFPDERLLEVLREAARDLGRTPSVQAYNRWRDHHPEREGIPSSALISQRLGWSNASVLAGLPVNRPRRGYSRITAEECVEWVRRSRVDLGAFPTTEAYTAWSKKDPARPSVSLIRVRVGGWRQVLNQLMAGDEAAA